MECLRDDAVKRIQSCFSHDFDVWAKAAAARGSNLVSYRDTDAIAAVNIARLTDTYNILPSALYTCCQLKSKDLLNGVPQANGTIERLTQADLLRCLKARKKFVHDRVVSTYRLCQFTPGTLHKCTTQPICPSLLKMLVNLEVTFGTEDYACLTDLIAWLEINSEDQYGNLCRGCQAHVQERALGLRAKMWSDLPMTLELRNVEVRGPYYPEYIYE
ncbi:uncharacterized protein C8Q71DRAFT_725213 [Rhodofomes roseus]|nr:uncharacterized protein C8Q71DRAFT_725213 [Rhodofomes roseus]KAH9833976.1 hypothetical protein C8Q71DRAFT_725213 [Rhodofomes roseus]